MNHESAWERLPDLLRRGPRAELLAHVRGCSDCQRRLFLLHRVDRILRQQPAPVGAARGRRGTHLIIPVALAAAAAVISSLVLLPRSAPGAMSLRTASHRVVAQVTIRSASGGNQLVSLDARGLPAGTGSTYALWALNSEGRRRALVGRFMADRSGSCHAEFTIPGNARPGSLEITPDLAADRPIATT